ncbi:MAG TPA: hypothetical protein DEF41_12020 [Desulfovibrio sp.]|uniref:Uncharacterized protein n=1 Tax=Nitratidesulfovibrio vulgaris (strain ATCC 29579 / DSM 644 / CCUG 34227 / NCIMB 8303 / VKM B-1760 / Hildenborough) TaxID=882 RepID=Q72FE2_NITV2|nr:hypothetical protein DVU_0272 [Nitratidesulfovibrio vulgaris str. Hildenborough]HBW16819.1 hypothetical protein [Desulfovibrio sp.]
MSPEWGHAFPDLNTGRVNGAVGRRTMFLSSH